jgi:hypothetical protein
MMTSMALKNQAKNRQMLKIGMNPEQLAQQVGTSYKMIKEHYQKYIPNPQDWHAAERLIGEDQRRQRRRRERQPVTFTVTHSGKRKSERLKGKNKPRKFRGLKMERVRRVELPTLCLASIRSSQLSYTRMGQISTSIVWACQFTTICALRSLTGRRAPAEGEKN